MPDLSRLPKDRGTGFDANSWRFAEWNEYAAKYKSFEDWVEARRNEKDGISEIELIADALTPIFLFLASGLKPCAKAKMGTLHQRAWCLLYAVRPDLIDGETREQAAARFGCNPQGLTRHLTTLQNLLPTYRRRSLDGHTKEGRPERFRRNASTERKVA